MELKESAYINTDVLIIGGGGAGLRAAIEASKAGLKVHIAAKSRIGYACNTAVSAAAFAAATGEKDQRDSVQVHIKDTVTGGHFINDQRLVEAVAQGSPQQVQDLVNFGVSFMQKEGKIRFAPSPGHSYPRTVCTKSRLGYELTLPLRYYAVKAGAKLAEGVCVTRLLTRDGAVVGAAGVDREGQVLIFRSKAIILATGGAGQIYPNTDNAGGMTGDGYALAYKLGLPLRDMEFVQFYPTALGRLGRTIMLYEALVAQLGATLRNSLNEDIIEKHGLRDPLVMTRDRLARAIFLEISEGRGVDGGIIMDLSAIHPENMEKAIRQLPFAPPAGKKHLIVAPTCHFFMGGVKINERGETGREGLWAAGEVCSGVHGANRLGANALAEVFAFGTIAGREAAAWITKGTSAPPEPENLNEALDDLKSLASSPGRWSEKKLRGEMKKAMWLHASIIREEKGLKETLGEIPSMHQNLSSIKVADPRELHWKIELRNMLLVSEMVCRAALMREESRGAHFRSDYPRENDRDWLRNIYITKRGEEMKLSPQPVEFYKVSPKHS